MIRIVIPKLRGLGARAVSLALTATVLSGIAHAAAPLPFSLPFPMMGIGADQTLRLNVAAWPGPACDITFAVYDGTGAAVTSGKLVSLKNSPGRLEAAAGAD